jgi:hypothetical protein
MKYYGVFEFFGRGNSIVETSIAELPDDEGPELVMAIMRGIARGLDTKEEVMEIYNNYRSYLSSSEEEKKVLAVEAALDDEQRETYAHLMEHPEDVEDELLDEIAAKSECWERTSEVAGTNKGFCCDGDEWKGGIALTKDDAETAFYANGREEIQWESE